MVKREINCYVIFNSAGNGMRMKFHQTQEFEGHRAIGSADFLSHLLDRLKS